MIEATWDDEVRAGYFLLSGDEVARTVQAGATVNVDLGSDGEMVGVEVLLGGMLVGEAVLTRTDNEISVRFEPEDAEVVLVSRQVMMSAVENANEMFQILRWGQ